MADDIDPDLKSLLDDLKKAEGSLDEAVTTPPPAPEVPEQEAAVPPPAELPKNEDLVESLQERTAPADFEETPPSFIAPATLEIEPEEDSRSAKIKDDVVKLLEGYVGSSGRMLEEFEVDRKKCDDLYNILITKIQSGTYSGSDATAVVMLLQAKSEISGNRSRHMDSIAKLLAAVKSNPVVGTGEKGGGGGSSNDDEVPSRSEILKLLERPTED